MIRLHRPDVNPSARIGWTIAVILIGALALTSNASSTAEEPAPSSVYSQWQNGPPTDPGFFPLAVWVQSPANAQKYRDAGINTYVALWNGPTEEQLAALSKAGMKLVCHQNKVGLKHRDNPTIIAWMHGDEPDNAQPKRNGGGYGPPIEPAKIQRDYQRIKAADPSRPVLLNLGQGVAWDNWIGRGVRRNHPEDYPEYLKGCDIASFDIYPAVHDDPEVAGKLWFVPYGVERLMRWTGGEKIIWNCLECSRIENTKRKVTPEEVRCEAWMSIIHGSRGLIYFVHQFEPTFKEASLLDDPTLLPAVTALNKQITDLAPVLNSLAVKDGATVETNDADAPVAVMTKRHAGATYIFAVAMRDKESVATFKLSNQTGERSVEVLDEHRTLKLNEGQFRDTFAPWEVHLYRIAD